MILSLLLFYGLELPAAVVTKSQQLRYQTHFVHGLKLERNGNLREANDEFRLALVAKPNESAPRMHLSLIALRQGARGEAILFAKSCLARNAKDKGCRRQYASLQPSKPKKR